MSRSRLYKATDRELVAAYKRTKSVHKAGKLLGMYGQTVHDRLRKLGVCFRNHRWTPREEQILLEQYTRYRDAGTLSDLAKKLGRTRQLLCRKARQLGLTHVQGPKLWNRVWKGLPQLEAIKIFERFKRSPLGVGQFCTKYGYDDLGFSRCMQSHFPDEWEHVMEVKCPRQTKYRLGRQVEYAVRDDLRQRAYPVVLRSPRSGGPVDLIALKTGRILLVQCKRSMNLGVAEWNKLFALAESVGAIAVLAGRPTGRGLAYAILCDTKDGSRRRQPMKQYNP